MIGLSQFEKWMLADLRKPPDVTRLSGQTFSGDSQANLIGVTVTNGGESVELTGNIVGYIIKPDGGMITVSGSKSGNRAWIVLPEEAYLSYGEITVSICEETTNTKTTLAVCVGTVYKATIPIE